MKKQKFMKLTAFASAPSIENSFSSPETHNAEISVVFSGKSVKIHGWDGSTWSMIYTWANMDKQFTFNNTYQNYFLESLTGQDELMSVSFFSIDSYQGSTPSLAGVEREVRLYDVDEVPIYTASDNGKMLTVMSDGTLQWLGENETWMIDGSPAPEAPSISISGGLVVDDDLFNSVEKSVLGVAPVVDLSNDKVYTFDGTGGFKYFNGAKYDPVDLSAVADVNLEYEGSARTYSIWFNADDLTGNKMLLGKWSRWGAFGSDAGWGIRLNNGTIQTWVDSHGGDGITNLDTYDPTAEGHAALSAGTWYHLAITFNNGVAKYYLNGELKRTDSTAGASVQTRDYHNSLLATDVDGDATYSRYFICLTLGTNTVETSTTALSEPFVGKLGHPAIYYSELPVEDISSIYQAQLSLLP